jgi:hypothetical protein
MTRAKPTRLRPAGVTPLEIWDPLVREVGAERVAALRRAGVAEVDIGRAVAAALAPALAALRARWQAEAVWLGGGLTEVPGVRELRAAYPLVWSRDGRFAAERGGLETLAAQGRADGVVIDVGQTAAKLSVVTAGRVVRREVRARPVSRSGGAEVAWIAAAAAGAPALVLALPCELDDACRPGACTYEGWEGDARVVERMCAPVAGPAWVMNDAELAAVSARAELDEQGPRAARALVVTLGFGPGGAVVEL